MSTRPWLKHNAWALIAIPVLVGGVFGAVALETDIRVLFGHNGASAPDLIVPAGETIELGGVEFGPVDFRVGSTVIDGNQPPETQIMLAMVPVSAGVKGIGCRNLAVVSESQDMVWLEATYELGVHDLPPDVLSTCSTGEADPAIIAGFFAVPESVTGPWAVELLVEQVGDGTFTQDVVRFETDASPAG